MRIGRAIQELLSRRAYTGSVLLPFLVVLFLGVEPAASQEEDYLPSSPSRAIALKLVSSLKSVHGGKTSVLNRDLTVDPHPLGYASYQAFVLVELESHRRHFGFLTNHLVRSPPRLPV